MASQEEMPGENPHEDLLMSVEVELNPYQHQVSSENNAVEHSVATLPQNLTSECVASQANKRKFIDEDDDDGMQCSICLEHWCNAGEHRLCSLKCGHLFGNNCIRRWLKSNKNCPNCKKDANIGHIRPIYANKLIAYDTIELENLKLKLESTVTERNLYQIEYTKLKTKFLLLDQELQDYKRHISKSALSQSASQHTEILKLKHMNKFHVCAEGSGRVMDINVPCDKFVVSLKSPHRLFQGYGIRQYNVSNMVASSYAPLHVMAIRDLKFNDWSSSLLSVSLDRTAKILDMHNNAVISNYTGECMLWSCCWDSNQHFNVYVGGQNGSVYKLDLRKFNEHVECFSVDGDMSPVVSMLSVKGGAGKPTPLGGFIACKLSSIWSFENQQNGDIEKNLIPLEGPFICVSSKGDNTYLVSARPNAQEYFTRHMVCSQDRDSDGIVKWNIVHNFNGGGLHKQLSRSCLVNYDEGTYVAAQKDSNIVLWSVNTGRQSAGVKCNNSVLDLMPLSNSKGTHLLGLSGNYLDVYRFHTSDIS